MIALAWHTARSRAGSLAGAFVALSLGVALLAALTLTLASSAGAARSPGWFTTPDVVVAGTDTVSVTSGSGSDRQTQTAGTDQTRAVPASLARRLSRLRAATVTDYAGYAYTPGAPGNTMHPWSAASLHSYGWAAGRPPATAGQIVLTAPTGYRPGDRVTVQTAAGPRQFVVSGVIRTAAPAALYGTDATAAALARGRVDAVALTAQAGTSQAVLAARVRAAATGQAVRVLTGTGRRDAEPNPDAVLFEDAVSVLGVTSGVAGFVSIIVVAGTFGYAVAARRREFGLLRVAGATPRQVRRFVLGEALAVSLLAAPVGGAAGIVIARPWARWMARSGLAPAGFTAHFILWPVIAAGAAGVLIALAGAWAAARRAGRVRPAEALREAEMDRGAMTVLRWLAGLAALAGAVPVIRLSASIRSADASALFLAVAMLLIVGCWMLAPVLVPPLTRLLGVPLSASRAAPGMLAAHSARTAVRRTVATAAPILVTLGIAGAALAGTDTLVGTQEAAAHSRITASAMVTPAPGGGIADSTVTAIRAVPGVRAAVPVTDTNVYVRSGEDVETWTGRYLGGPGSAGVLRLPVVAGRLSALTGTGTVAVPAGGWRLGQIASLWLGDSAPVRLRVVAVLANQIDLAQTVLLPWALRDAHTTEPIATQVYLRLAGGVHLGALRAAATAGGGTLTSAAGQVSAADALQNRVTNLLLIAVLGLTLAYSAIAIANTLAMATGNRARELGMLRLAGATPGQVLRLIGLEAALVAGIGILLAAAVTAITVTGLRAGLSGLAPAVRVIIPWQQLSEMAAACLVIALLASVIPAALTLRKRPADLAGAIE